MSFGRSVHAYCLQLISNHLPKTVGYSRKDSNMCIIGQCRHEKSCKMSRNQNSGIQMSTHILVKKYAI